MDAPYFSQGGDSEHGNILLLEHLNINMDSAEAALAFFMEGLGCAQDPRIGPVVDGKVYVSNVLWMNAGMSQFHIPITTRGNSGAYNNVFQGRIGLQVPCLVELRRRLGALGGAGKLGSEGTRFAWADLDGGAAVEVTGPSGNTWIATEAKESARDTRGYHPGALSWCLAVPFVEFRCPVGTCAGIARYYSHYLGAIAEADAGAATVRTSPQQCLRFIEDPAYDGTDRDPKRPPYHEAERGIHLCIYVLDHAGPMERLSRDGLLWGNPRFRDLDRGQGLTQFRLKDLVDPLDGSRPRAVLMELEHEVRNLQHKTCPFGHTQPWALPSRQETVPALVSTVSSAYEKDWSALREELSRIQEGFVPMVAANL